ncbi:hypothetical protein OROHE_022147 [Orobanche hederae]
MSFSKRMVIMRKIDPVTGALSGPLDEETAANELWKEILERKGLPLDTPYVLKTNIDEYLNLPRDESYCDYLWRRIYHMREQELANTQKRESEEKDASDLVVTKGTPVLVRCKNVDPTEEDEEAVIEEKKKNKRRRKSTE